MRIGNLVLHAVVVSLAIGCPGVAQAEPPLLAPPTRSIDRVLPLSVIDTLKESGFPPLRVAARPTLEWGPGLKKAADSVATKTPAELTGRASKAEAEAPALVSPRGGAEPESPVAEGLPVRQEAAPVDQEAAPAEGVALPEKAAPPEPQEVDEIEDPPETALLPEQAPRAKKVKTPTRAAAPPVEKEKPAAEAPAEKQPVTEEPVAEEPEAETPAAKEPARLITPESSRAIKPIRPAAKPEREAKPDLSAAPKAGQQSKAPQQKPEPRVEPRQGPMTGPAKPSRPAELKPPAPLSRSLRGLRSRLRTVLSFYYRKPLNTVEHDPWEIMHNMLSYELHSRIHDGAAGAPYMTAIGHLCFNRPSKRQRLMQLTEDGSFEAKVGVGVQGHKGQFLAMLAQCNVSPDYPIRVGGESFTIRDLIGSEQRSCESNTELTFKLIGLGHYLDSDADWLDERGERWDIPRLIREERAQPIRGAACGGTHRLAGLSLAFRRREARGEPIDGEYAEAAKFVARYQAYAFRLQNRDGSLSTEWFRGPGEVEDIDRRLRTTGHLLEWLVYSLPDEQLRSHQTVRAVNYLTNLLAGNADHEWHLGSIAHAIHALVLYDKRVFRPHDKPQEGQLATVDPTARLFRDYPIYRGVMRNSPPESTGLFQGLFGGSRTGSAANRRR